MDADHAELMNTVLTSAETLTDRRARVYRALARTLATPAHVKELDALADSLLDIGRRSLALKSNILHKSA